MLFISGHLPSLTFPEAGQKICFQNLIEYSKYKDIDLIVLVNARESLYANKDEFNFCRSVTFIHINIISRLFGLLTGFYYPFHVAVRNETRLIKVVKKYIEINPFAEIHIEYAQVANLLFYLPKNIDATVVFHDVLSQSIHRKYSKTKYILRLFWWIQYCVTLAWERRLSTRVKTAVVLSSKDKDLLIDSGFGCEQIKIDPPKVSDEFYKVRRDGVQSNAIVFWGAMNRAENEDAVFWFVDEILPYIHKKSPDIIFYVVGANPSSRLSALHCSKIIITGFVDSPISFFERAALIVAPLRFGAGVKIKVLEAIAASVPVVATTVAAEGISKSVLLNVVDDPRLFADKVLELLNK